MTGLLHKLKLTLSLVKFSHTIFALPFALASALLALRTQAAGSTPRGVLLAWIVVAMAGARTAAMAFNRIVDLRFDRENPRARDWPLVTGALSVPFAWGVFAAGSGALAIAAWRLNPLAFKLAPLALLIVCFYSLTKRFTPFTHFFLGLALGVAPIAAWIALTGTLAAAPLLLGGAVGCWVAGFDLIYHCVDAPLDRTLGLHSVPARWGNAVALSLARLLHLLMLAMLVACGALAGLGAIYFAGLAALAGLLVWEHRLVKPDDLSRVNVAFFTLNGWAAVVFLIAVALDLRVTAR